MHVTPKSQIEVTIYCNVRTKFFLGAGILLLAKQVFAPFLYKFELSIGILFVQNPAVF